MDTNTSALEMFFDEDFDSSNFVDAFYASIIGNQSPYTEKNLQQIQKKSVSLVYHLDFYNSQLSTQLTEKINRLRETNQVVSSIEGDEITRLEYYLKSMNNAVSLLEQELTIGGFKENEKITQTDSASATDIENQTRVVQAGSEPQPSTNINQLIQLKMAKERLIHVQQIFAKLDPILGDNKDSISTEQFESRLNSVYDSIRKEAEISNAHNNTQLVSQIDELASLLPLFQGTPFHSIFKKFATKIVQEKEKIK